MKIVKKYDKETIKKIVKNCGSKNVKNTYSYLDVINYRSKEKFYCEILDDVAFFAGTIGKKHFRLIECAVDSENQKKGYGKLLIYRIKSLCKNCNLNKITLRTSKEENAVYFFLKMGGNIIGEKDNDYEMELYL